MQLLRTQQVFEITKWSRWWLRRGSGEPAPSRWDGPVRAQKNWDPGKRLSYNFLFFPLELKKAEMPPCGENFKSGKHQTWPWELLTYWTSGQRAPWTSQQRRRNKLVWSKSRLSGGVWGWEGAGDTVGQSSVALFECDRLPLGCGVVPLSREGKKINGYQGGHRRIAASEVGNLNITILCAQLWSKATNLASQVF